MNEQGFTAKDWAIFRSRIAAWQENYMDRLNNEYIALLSEDAAPSEKFWCLEKRVREDKRRTGVHLEMSRSNFVFNLVSLINDGAIRVEDLQDFSDELKTTVSIFLNKE